ncbi:MAG: EpsG family protein, partial [Spirochaetota bacterium]
MLAIVLIFIAGFRPIGIDRDSPVYYNEIIDYVHGSQSFTLLEREPMYFIIVSAAKPFGDFAPRLVFIIYAMISITVLFVAIKRIAKYPYMSIFLYICLFYLLFNMTQMRASIAASLYLYSLDDIQNKKFSKFAIKILIAVLFHYSAMILFPFYCITPKDNLKQRLLYATLPMIGIIIGLYNITHLYNLTTRYVGHLFLAIPGLSKVDGYFNTVQLQGSINPFNLYVCSYISFLWIG